MSLRVTTVTHKYVLLKHFKLINNLRNMWILPGVNRNWVSYDVYFPNHILTHSYFSFTQIFDTTRIYIMEFPLLKREGIPTGCLIFLVQNSKKRIPLWVGKVAFWKRMCLELGSCSKNYLGKPCYADKIALLTLLSCYITCVPLLSFSSSFFPLSFPLSPLPSLLSFTPSSCSFEN